MKEKISELIKDSIQEYNVFLEDAFVDTEDGKKRLNIVLDSEETIDLNRITDASRVIFSAGQLQCLEFFKIQIGTVFKITGGIKHPFPVFCSAEKCFLSGRKCL